MPHPLEHKFVLKVQTEKPLTPSQALEKTVDRLIGDLASLEERVRVNFQWFYSSYYNKCFYCRMKLNEFLLLNHQELGKSFLNNNK